MKNLRIESRAIDRIDARLIDALVADARTSIAELARVVGLSAPSVSERIRRMEASGLIEGYAARINPGALGLPLSAWLRVRPLPGKLARVVGILKNMPQVVDCDRITGDDCFLARVHVASVADLERLIDEIIPYATTNTSIIQSSPVAGRLPPLGRA